MCCELSHYTIQPLQPHEALDPVMQELPHCIICVLLCIMYVYKHIHVHVVVLVYTHTL